MVKSIYCSPPSLQFISFMSMNILLAHMYVNRVCLVPEIRTEHLRRDLWVVINHQMSAGNQTWFSSKSGTAVNSKPAL